MKYVVKLKAVGVSLFEFIKNVAYFLVYQESICKKT